MEKISKDFRFKKQFGQNFIFDKNFLTSLVTQFNLDKNSQVLEIGAGAGTLTEVLANNFRRVISVEIDKTLKEKLGELESKHSNLTFVFNDILKINTKDIDNWFDESYFLIANLPYYITSQIVFKFLVESKKIKSMFVMVQKEVGERFSAKSSTKEYGIPSVIINTFGSCKILKFVSKKMFIPQPQVDSCMIEINIDKTKNSLDNCEDYFKFVSKCFMMRRKTLYNNLIKMSFSKDEIFNAFNKLNLSDNCRPENLTSENYVNLYKELNKN